MEEILNPTTDFNKQLTTQYFIKNEIFLPNPFDDGRTTVINNEKLSQFLEMLQKQVFEINTQVTACVSEDLYRQEIQERYELTRKMDSTLLDINYLREYIYYGDPQNKVTGMVGAAGGSKDKTQFLIGEIENLKMMMKRVEKQQYEGLDLFRRVKKSENHIVTLAKLINERVEKEKFMSLQIEELQNQMNEMKQQIDSNQQSNEKKQQEHHDRISEIELALEEEELEQEASVQESKSLMRSMSISIGDLEEDLRKRLHRGSMDADDNRPERTGSLDVQSFDFQDNSVNMKAIEVPESPKGGLRSNRATFLSRREDDERPDRVARTKSVSFSARSSVDFGALNLQNLPIKEEEEITEAQDEKEEERDDQPEQTVTQAANSPPTEKEESAPQKRQEVILASGRVVDRSDYPHEGLLRLMSRNNSIRTTYPSQPSSTRSSMYLPTPQNLFHRPSTYNNDRRSSRRQSRLKSTTTNLELLEFLKTQYFEKLQNLELQSYLVQTQLKQFEERFTIFNLTHLKKILLIFSNSYSKQMKKLAFHKLLMNKLSFDQRKRETLLRNCTIFVNRLLKTTIRYNFKKWKRNVQRLMNGEKMKLWLVARLEKWYEHVKPNLKNYLNRWKIFTIASYRAALFTGEDEDDIDAFRNANNQYFLSLRQTLLNRGEFNMEELKQNALQDMRSRWSSADRKAKEEERYKMFEDRILMKMDEYYNEQIATEKDKYNKLILTSKELHKEFNLMKKDLSRILIQVGDFEPLFQEKTEVIMNKVLTNLNNYKSQYIIQMTYMKESIDEQVQQLVQKQTFFHEQLTILQTMKQDYDDNTIPMIKQYQINFNHINDQLNQHQTTFQLLKQENELKDNTILTITEVINNNQKTNEKSLKALENHVDDSNQFFSEEMVWMKNLSKNIHQSLQDFKVIYDTYVTKTNKTIDVILSGESSHEQYQILIQTVCHYYKQYEFYQLIQVQQIVLMKEVTEEQQRVEAQQAILDPHSTSESKQPPPPQNSSSNALQKKLKILNEIKEKYSQQFVHEQRKKISDELSEAIRRLAFYVVVKSDNYVTSHYVLNQILKMNHTFKFADDYQQPPPINVTQTTNKTKTTTRPHSANATMSKLKTSKLPPKSPDKLASTPGRAKTVSYAFDDNETTNAKLSKVVSTHLYTFNNDNLSIDSIRKQYIQKIREEIEKKLSAKDDKQLYRSSFSSTSSTMIGGSAADLIMLTNANIPMIKEIRDKFISQFMKMLEITLVSFPKIPFFHGINSTLRTNSIFPATSGVSVPLENCLACDRPLIDDWKGQGMKDNRRPRSASHITSTYHHNPFQGFVQNMFTQGNHNNNTNNSFLFPVISQQMFMPVALPPNQFTSETSVNTRSAEYLQQIPTVTKSHSMDSQQSILSYSQTEGDLKTSVKSKSDTNNMSINRSISRSMSDDNQSIHQSASSHELVLDETPTASAKLTITLKGKRDTVERSPSPSSPTGRLSQKIGSPQSRPHDRVMDEFTTRTTLSPTSNDREPTLHAHSIIESYSQVQAHATLPLPEHIDASSIPFIAEATIPALNSEVLADTLAYQFPKDVSIRPKYLESSIRDSLTPEISLQSRKIFGKDEKET